MVVVNVDMAAMSSFWSASEAAIWRVPDAGAGVDENILATYKAGAWGEE